MSGLPPGRRDAEAEPPPGFAAEPARTASGLEEAHIAADDIAALRGQFSFAAVPVSVDCTVQRLDGWELPGGRAAPQQAPLAIAAVRAQRLKLAPLPGRVKTQALRLDALRVKLQRDLALAVAQPVRRPRTSPADLTRAEQDAVNAAYVAKYGGAARQLKLEGVFREVPPEAAKSVRLDEALRFCQFRLPEGTAVHKLRSGYALAVALGDSGKTYPLLVRL